MLRLSDEALLLELAEAVEKYYLRVGSLFSCAAVALLQVEHLYYKHDTVATAVRRAHLFTKTWGKYAELHPASLGNMEVMEREKGAKKRDVSRFHPASFQGNPTVNPAPYSLQAHLERLCSFIFQHGDERYKTRALLCAVYHHALHDRYYHARDLFLISHIQESIDKAETKTQILYNRALVTLGLAAFRQGLIVKAHDCLSIICSGRVRELLAQGQSRWHEKDPEQEKAERRRQMPYHMHINPDLLDCCHLTCAMLLELPQMAKQSPNPQLISRHFRKFMQLYNRQIFTGPPENTREHVLAAAKCMLAGDWSHACENILSLEVWNLIPGDGGEKVKQMLRVKIQEESLRIYLLSYSIHYDTMSLSNLCEMFSMDPVSTRRVISRMIYQREIYAAWDQPPDLLQLYKVDSTPLQTVSQQIAEKLAVLVDNNEKLMDPLGGSYGHGKDDWSGRDGRDARDQRKQWGGAAAGDNNMRNRQWLNDRSAGGGERGRGGGYQGRGGGRSRGRAGGRGWSNGQGRTGGRLGPTQNQSGGFNRTQNRPTPYSLGRDSEFPKRNVGWGAIP